MNPGILLSFQQPMYAVVDTFLSVEKRDASQDFSKSVRKEPLILVLPSWQAEGSGLGAGAVLPAKNYSGKGPMLSKNRLYFVSSLCFFKICAGGKCVLRLII